MKKKPEDLPLGVYILMLIVGWILLLKLCGFSLSKEQPKNTGPTETVRIEVRPGHYIDFPKVR